MSPEYERYVRDGHRNTPEERLSSVVSGAGRPVACGRSAFQTLFVEEELREPPQPHQRIGPAGAGRV